MASKKVAATAAEETGSAKTETRFAKFLASEAMAKINKKYGSATLIRASDEHNQTIVRIPSGIFPLDYSLGGGWAAGRVHTCFGHKSSSKTTTLLKTVSNAQKMCASCYKLNYITKDGEVVECGCNEQRDMVCAFVDVENAFDPSWATKLGVDLDRLMYCRPDFAEEALDICEALIRSAEVDILVLDSLAFLTPTKEIEDSVEKESMGVQPRLIGKFVRKLNAALSAVKNEHSRLPTIFFTNQIRMKIGVMFGNPETQPGGNSPGFVSTTEVRFAAGKYDMDEITGRPNHVDLNFKIEKNKSAATAKMEGTYRLILNDNEFKKSGDVYDEHIILSLAERCGVVEGSGSSWRCMGEQFRGKSLIEQEMLKNKPFKAKLCDTLMKILLAA